MFTASTQAITSLVKNPINADKNGKIINRAKDVFKWQQDHAQKSCHLLKNIFTSSIFTI